MKTARLEAYSDAVIAIVITIMVLELRPPEDASVEALKPLVPTFLSYVLSFLYLSIYWNNHHHLLGAIRRVSSGIMWANVHLLFWLSLIPFTTSWLSEHPAAAWPTALYGANLLMAALAYSILTFAIIAHEGKKSRFGTAVGRDYKGNVSLALYLSGLALAFAWPTASYALYVAVALIWLVPDKRTERLIKESNE